ncbi:AAA family ATPase [Tsukamurella sp. NPDC003166]|uniref:AAA family ATPase n=1 Tax=Tsukamurella sp. NPDC003166 TaxID=3154444 RepID=UPI0033BFB557
MTTPSDAMPPWQHFIHAVLAVLSDGRVWATADLKHAAVDAAGLSEELRAETFDTGGNRAENRVGWALSHLTRGGAVHKPQFGRSQITDAGRRLLAEHPNGVSQADVEELPEYWNYVPVKRSRRAPQEDSDDQSSYWFVGAYFRSDTVQDQTEAFVREGIWRNGYADKYLDLVRAMQPGERIAIKAAFTRKYDLPFDTHGYPVSVMAIKATGTIEYNDGDGRTVTVDWDPLPDEQREWYFYTNQQTVWRVRADQWTSRSLIDFTFDGADQDLDSFRNYGTWADRFGDDADDASPTVSQTSAGASNEADQTDEETPDTDTYGIDEIIDDGCFIDRAELATHLEVLRRKKNLILQGPPGTGKTWLAKRLARALIGMRAPGGLLTPVQFHPSTSYEEFVRGWRPNGEGRLDLEDGLFLKAVAAAQADPGHSHVVVIEEINRANLAQVFGELLTLLEADKRTASEALTLSTPRSGEPAMFLPTNLYVIGTMNLADRSLAMVDFALRRRFAFADLAPTFNDAWRTWVRRNSIDDSFLLGIAARVEAINESIRDDRALGEQYCIGHSFFTPPHHDPIVDPELWIDQVVEQEIRPLLTEYWFDAPERVNRALETLRR